MIESAAFYAGSFDPPTKGHLWVIARAAEMFERVFVAVAHNPAKKRAFSVADSVAVLGVECARIADAVVQQQAPEISVVPVLPSRYVADVARELGAKYMIRGLRGPEDVALEQTLADFADRRAGMTTIILMPPPALRGLSSSYVRALVGPQGWRRVVRPLVPRGTLDLLTKGTRP